MTTPLPVVKGLNYIDTLSFKPSWELTLKYTNYVSCVIEEWGIGDNTMKKA